MKYIKPNIEPGDLLIGKEIEISEDLVKRLIKENPELRLADVGKTISPQGVVRYSQTTKTLHAVIDALEDGINNMKTYTGGGSVNEKDKRINKQETIDYLKELKKTI